MTIAHLPPEPSPLIPLVTAQHPRAGRPRPRRAASSTERDTLGTVRTHPDRDRDPAGAAHRLTDVWDRHGASVYTVAIALLGDERAAEHAVRMGLTDLAAVQDTSTQEDDLRSWTRHVYVRSQELAGAGPAGTAPLPSSPSWFPHLAQVQRACLALCLFGGHTYREVAQLLDVPPTTVADLLTTSLREAQRWSGGPDTANA